MVLDQYDHEKHGDFGEWYNKSIDKLHEQQKKMEQKREVPLATKPMLHRHNKPRIKKNLDYKRQVSQCVEEIMYKLQFHSTLMDSRMNSTRMAIQEQNEEFEEAYKIVRKQEQKAMLAKRRAEKQRQADEAAAEMVRKQKEFLRFPKLAPIAEVIPLESTDVAKLKAADIAPVEQHPLAMITQKRKESISVEKLPINCAIQAKQVAGCSSAMKAPLLYPSALNQAPPRLLTRRKTQVQVLPDSPVKTARNITNAKQYRKVKTCSIPKIKTGNSPNKSGGKKEAPNPLLASPEEARDRVKQRLTGGIKPHPPSKPKPLQTLAPRPPTQARPTTQGARRRNVRKLRPLAAEPSDQVVAHKPPRWR